jgi:hypothetical protein
MVTVMFPPRRTHYRASPIGSLRIDGCNRSLRSLELKDKLIKTGAKVVSHGRYVSFQMAEVTIPRQIFQEILRLIAKTAANAAVNACVRRSIFSAQEQPT